MSDSQNRLRKRLFFRCHHMGTAENDVLFGRFAKQHMNSLNAGQLEQLERLLDQSDINLFKWVMGIKPPPAAFDTDIMGLIKDMIGKA